MRYIDDCVCVWPHSPDALTTYFEYVNSVHPTIKFAIERSDTVETSRQLPFLDTLIKVSPDGHFTTELYIHKAGSSTYHRPFRLGPTLQNEKAVVKSQFLRFTKVSSDPLSARRSTNKINSLFLSNGYPSRWLAGVARQAQQQHANKTHINRAKKDKIVISPTVIDDALTRKVDAALRSVKLDMTASWSNENTLTKRLVRSALEPPHCRGGNRSCRTCNSGLRGRCTIKKCDL